MSLTTHRCVPDLSGLPTKLLVYVVRDAAAPAPVVRWYGRDGSTPMQASAQRLRMPVDRSPDGLSAKEYEKVQRFPAQLDLVLWAPS